MGIFNIFRSKKDNTTENREADKSPRGVGDTPLNATYTPEAITTLGETDIFVFGSNLAGSHGGGAARIAFDRFGAVWGEGQGLHGNTYAIPTMQGGVDTVRPYVDQFIEYAKSHPSLTFYVTKIGCGIAGFSILEMAPLFREARGITNIVLPKEFVEVIESDDPSALTRYAHKPRPHYIPRRF